MFHTDRDCEVDNWNASPRGPPQITVILEFCHSKLSRNVLLFQLHRNMISHVWNVFVWKLLDDFQSGIRLFLTVIFIIVVTSLRHTICFTKLRGGWRKKNITSSRVRRGIITEPNQLVTQSPSPGSMIPRRMSWCHDISLAFCVPSSYTPGARFSRICLSVEGRASYGSGTTDS